MRPGRPPHDLTGQQFGRLTALSPAERSPAGRVQWLCACTGGDTTPHPPAEVTVEARLLRSGGTRSCGCLQAEAARRSALAARQARQKVAAGFYLPAGLFTALAAAWEDQARGEVLHARHGSAYEQAGDDGVPAAARTRRECADQLRAAITAGQS